MIKITITLEEALGADKLEVTSQVTEAIYKALEEPAIGALFINCDLSSEQGINPEFYPTELYDSGKKGVEKTEANSCQLRFIGGSWVISDISGDHPYVGIDAVIRHINLKQLYITDETIITEEYAKQLWYKIK